MIRHGWVGFFHCLADFVLEQEIRGRRSFGRVWIARLLDPPPFYDLPFLGVVGLAFPNTIRLGRNNRELGRRHHLFHVQLGIHSHRWTSCEGRTHWGHGLDNLERSRSEAMEYVSILVTDFSTFSHSIREGVEMVEEL